MAIRATTTQMENARIAALLAPFVPETLREAQIEAIDSYLGTLLRWNARMNLTAVRDPEEALTRHFGESLFLASRLFPTAAAAKGRVVDVGSGAGFPGLALRIYAPVAVTLIESKERKAVFLREVARQLKFSDVVVFAGRAEDYPLPPGGGPVTVTMRAVEKFEEVLHSAARIAAASFETGAETAAQTGVERGAVMGRLALLIGAGQVERARQLEPRFEWAEPEPVPRSQTRVLLVGELPLSGS